MLGSKRRVVVVHALARIVAHVIAFNGYAAQYKKEPIVVKKGETMRMLVLNCGP